jgi:Flp pilus assembly protein TadG
VRWIRRYIHLLRGRDRGTVAITFLLSLPLLMLIIGLLVQLSLLVNARLTLDRAATAAARSAMTSLPADPVIDQVDGMSNVRRAAYIALAPISPVAPAASTDGETVGQALAALSGGNSALPRNFAGRYTYAEAATLVEVDPIDANGVVLPMEDFSRAAAPRIRLTLRYDFRLTVPLINMPLVAVFGRSGTVAGITGRFFTISTTREVQLSPGREVPTGITGEP